MYNAMCEEAQYAPIWVVSTVRHFSVESKTTDISENGAPRTNLGCI
jgi:hypothetical protein